MTLPTSQAATLSSMLDRKGHLCYLFTSGSFLRIKLPKPQKQEEKALSSSTQIPSSPSSSSSASPSAPSETEEPAMSVAVTFASPLYHHYLERCLKFHSMCTGRVLSLHSDLLTMGFPHADGSAGYVYLHPSLPVFVARFGNAIRVYYLV